MKLRRALAPVLAAVLILPFVRFVGAQDANTPPPAAGDQPPADAAPAAPAPAAPTPAPTAAAPKAAGTKKSASKSKKKSSPGKKKPAPESKYKTRALSENSGSHYRFDEDGNPIDGAAKKKPGTKAKKKSSEDPEDKAACTDDAPCSDKKSSEADAL